MIAGVYASDCKALRSDFIKTAASSTLREYNVGHSLLLQ